MSRSMQTWIIVGALIISAFVIGWMLKPTDNVSATPIRAKKDIGVPQIKNDDTTNIGNIIDTKTNASEMQQQIQPTQVAKTASSESKKDIVYGQCQVRVQGKAVMEGDCSGLADESTVFVTSESDGCTVEMVNIHNRTAKAKIFAYKNTCWLDKAAGLEIENDIDLGELVMNKEDCWVGRQAKICLYQGD